MRAFLAGLGEKKGSPVRVGPRLKVAPEKWKAAPEKGKWKEVPGSQLKKWSWEVGDGTEYQVLHWSEEGWSLAYFDSPDAERGDQLRGPVPVHGGLWSTYDNAIQHAVAHHRVLRSGSAVRVGPRLRVRSSFLDGERWLRVNRALHKLFASLLPVENDEWHQLLTLVPTGLRGKGALFGDDLPPLPIAFQDVVVRVHDDEDGTGLTVFTPHITNPRHRQGDRHGDHSWGPMHVNRAAAHLTDSLAVGFGFSPWTFDWEQRVKITGGTWDGKYGKVTGRNVSGGMGLSDRMRARYADPSDLGWQSAEGEPAYLLELRPGGGGIWYSGEALAPVRETKRGKS
jgi:hypothetical protein